MNFLEERIAKDGVVKPGNVLKVDSFLNHQMDVTLMDQMGEEFKRRFADKTITKVLTIESSGIGIACSVARALQTPMVFAKKAKNRKKNTENSASSGERLLTVMNNLFYDGFLKIASTNLLFLCFCL